MLVLFAGIFNGVQFVLTDTLFSFFEYPSFPVTLTNPLYILFPVVFCYFSLPSIVLVSLQSRFSLKKRFLLLAECHAFFFSVQVLFWVLFCWFTLHHAETVLQVLLGYNQEINSSLTAIFMPLVAVRLAPLLGIFFLWVSIKATLGIVNDEEKKYAADGTVFSDTEENFLFMPKQAERAFMLVEFGNVFLLLCLLGMFLPLQWKDSLPALSVTPFVFLVCFLQYYLLKLYKREKRRSLLVLGCAVQAALLCFALIKENFVYQCVFIVYFLSQMYALYCFMRYGKTFFVKD